MGGKFSICFTLAVSAVLALGSSDALAQGYPSQPIRIIVPFTPGGINDFAARSVSSGLSSKFNVPVIVDNRAGAGGIVGTQLALQASPDGYTVIVGSVASHAIVQNLHKPQPYDVVRDFVAVTMIAETPLMVVAHPSLPVKSIKDLLSLARTRPGRLNFASSGSGTATHLSAELFNKMGNVKLTHIPYKSAGPAVIDLIAGHVTLMFATMPSVLPHVQAKKLRALAITSAQRSESVPEVPTVAESGVPGYHVSSWSGMFAPAKTPIGAVNRLAEEIRTILSTPTSKKYFFSLGAIPIGNSPSEFGAFVSTEVARWKQVIDYSGARAD